MSQDTANLLRQFGAASALAGVNLSTPLSAATGGFANAPLTPSGGMAGAR